MIRVYVAGPYSGTDIITCLKNIGRGEWYAAELFRRGFAPFCPWHDKDFAMKLWDQDLSVDQFYQYSLAWLEVSDALYLVPGWEESAGTLKEIEFARQHGIPVFYDFAKLVNWADEKNRQRTQ